MNPKSPFPPSCAARYRFERVLGRGGFGSVSLARQIGLDRSVAIKLLIPDALADDEHRQRLRNEAQVTASLQHPHIVYVVELGLDADVPWIAYEYLSGPSLRDLMANGPLPVATVATASRQIAAALAFAHERSIWHRDIKPENVLEASPGHFKVTDFGIAKWSSPHAVQTRAGLVMGSPAYMAPEIIRGEPCSAASDLYALGATMFELATGAPPYGGDDLTAVLEAHLQASIPAARSLRPDLPLAFEALLSRLLAKDPASRPADAALVEAELASLLREATVPAAVRSGARHPRPRASGPVEPRANPVPGLPLPQAPSRPAPSRSARTQVSRPIEPGEAALLPVLSPGTWGTGARLLPVGSALALVLAIGIGTVRSPKALPPPATATSPASPADPATSPSFPVTPATSPASPTPPGRTPVRADEPMTLSTRWKTLSPGMLAWLAGPTANDAAADLALRQDLPALRTPGEWLYWVALGRWLDAEDPGRGPPELAGATRLRPDRWSTKDEAQVHAWLNEHGLKELHRELLAIAIKTTGTYPRDPLSWVLLGASLAREDQPRLALNALRQATKFLDGTDRKVDGLDELARPLRGLWRESRAPGTTETLWKLVLGLPPLSRHLEALLPPDAASVVPRSLADPLLTLCTVERAGDFLTRIHRPDLAFELWSSYFVRAPRSSGLAVRLLWGTLYRGDIDRCARLLDLIDRTGPAAEACSTVSRPVKPLAHARFALEVDADPRRSPSVYAPGTADLALQLLEMFRRLEQGDVASAERLVPTLLSIASDKPSRIVSPLDDLLGMGSKQAGLIEPTRKALLASPLELGLWLQAAGSLATTTGTPIMESLIADAAKVANPADRPVVAVTRMVWLSRCGRLAESLQVLKNLEREFPGRSFDPPSVLEVLSRPFWLEALGRDVPADVIAAALESHSLSGNGPAPTQWQLLKARRYDDAVEQAELWLQRDAFRIVWHLPALWNALRTSNRTAFDRAARRTRSVFRYRASDGWELRRIAARQP